MRECNKCGHRNCGCSYLEKTGKTVDDREYTKEGYLIGKSGFFNTTNWQAIAEEMAEAALAYQELNTCLRIGKCPTEKLFKRLDNAKVALDKFNKAKEL